VITSLPVPGIAVASTNRTSPPVGVQARPVATPGTRVLRRLSAKNFCRPSSALAFLPETLTFFPLPSFSAKSRATFRQTVPISRSRFRTPASRVYSSMIAVSAGSVNSIWPGFRPFASICLGTRYLRAMCIFSSVV